jgi:hypothetical protein
MFGGSRFSGSIMVKDHPNAEIYVNGNRIGQGTVVGVFPRNRALNVEVKQEGCDPKTQTFEHSFRGGNFACTIFMFGVFGILIDLGTGASYQPGYRNNPAVEKMGVDNFAFTVDYSGCAIDSN